MKGSLDLVRISNGDVLFSQDLQAKTGNIVSLAKTNNRQFEIVMATQNGIFFANVGKGSGLRMADIQRLDKENFQFGAVRSS